MTSKIMIKVNNLPRHVPLRNIIFNPQHNVWH